MQHPWLSLVALVASVLVSAPGRAQPVRLRYTFQPDCFRPSLTAMCDRYKVGQRLDLGPQIAVWVESADGTRFVDTLMVTSATAFRGIGNRPGHVSLPSGPKFPYGKRPMVLPVWAHKRGTLYSSVVMQDGADKELWLGFHEAISSAEPYYCKPLTDSEAETAVATVDAVTCPSANFNSAKGRHSTTEPQSYYPPRNDLSTFGNVDCDQLGQMQPGCATSARSFAALNDLDAVAAATPRYGQPYTGAWIVPDSLPDGAYALFLEISKEFDQNASHAYPAYTDPNLPQAGIKTNFGQPSVVFRVPFTLSRSVAAQAATSAIVGYGTWNGASGKLHPADSTISDRPGSGTGRLLVIAQPAIGGGSLSGRVHITTDPPAIRPDAGTDRDGGDPESDARTDEVGPAPACPMPPARAQVTALLVPVEAIKAETAQATFVEPAGSVHGRIAFYEVRVWAKDDPRPDAFAGGAPVAKLPTIAPGELREVKLPDLKAQGVYTVGVQPVGTCLDGVISYRSFTTVTRTFKQLSGCFIATAAYGTPQAADVNVLRSLRDRARNTSAFAAALIALYERSSPPLADLLRGSNEGKALMRRALEPVVGSLKVAERVK